MAVVPTSGSLPSLTAELLPAEPIVALLPPDHSLSDRRAVHLLELADDEFVALRSGGRLQTLMNEMCEHAGFTPRVSVETGQLSMLWRMVHSGMGVAVVPRLAAGDLGSPTLLSDRYADRASVAGTGPISMPETAAVTGAAAAFLRGRRRVGQRRVPVLVASGEQRTWECPGYAGLHA
jgi:DNA-binding transcriptional LysR family regulator